MDATDYKEIVEELRVQRLQDPTVTKNGRCAECDFKGYIKQPDGTWKTCQCEKSRLLSNNLDNKGVPRKFRGAAWDAIAETEGKANQWSDGRVNAMNYIKHVYVESIDEINAGKRWDIKAGHAARSIALIGGSRRVKSAWASQLFEEMYGRGGLKYFQFSELKAMLSDFKRLDEQRDWASDMGYYDLVVVDGIHAGACGPAFPAAWDAGIAARQNSGKVTILLCEDDYAIDSYAWRDMLDDPDMLVLPFSLEMQAAPQQAGQPASTSQHKAVSRPAPTLAREVITQDDAEAAILDFLGKNPEKIIKLIYDNVSAPRDTVKAALDSLLATGDVLKRQKAGKNGAGTMTVFCLRPQNQNSADDAAAPEEAKQMTFSELQEITGIPCATLWRYRNAGQSDEEIIRRAENSV